MRQKLNPSIGEVREAKYSLPPARLVKWYNSCLTNRCQRFDSVTEYMVMLSLAVILIGILLIAQGLVLAGAITTVVGFVLTVKAVMRDMEDE